MWKNGTLIMDDSDYFSMESPPRSFEINSSLTDLAQDFSIFYKTRDIGKYYSDDGRYLIHYVDAIIDNSGRVLKTPARVGLTTGKIELNKSILCKNDAYDDNFVFYTILWCYVEGHFQNIERSDRFMLNFYLNTTRSRGRLYKGLNAMFRDSESLQNKMRDVRAFDILLPSDAFDAHFDFEFLKRLLIC